MMHTKMHKVAHPGPERAARMDLALCDGREIGVTLAAHIPLEDAVAQALAPFEFDSAFLEVNNADVDALNYVIPADAPDDTHVAWYSQTKGFDKGRIDRLGMIVGRHLDHSFIHGHGLWTPDNGTQAMGHILAPQTALAAPAQARGIGLNGARFDRRRDEETNFDLFHVDQLGAAGKNFAALRLLPNQDFTSALDAACQACGWPSAKVQGIGSINRPCFEDGRMLDSLPTELLVLDAIAGANGMGPEIAVVGTKGDDILTGHLSRGANAVLVTAELVLSKLDA